MTQETESWHLDKRVPMATIMVLVVQLIGGVWFASMLSHQVGVLTTAAEQRDLRISQVERSGAAQAISFATLNAQLTAMRETMTEMKDVQRETNALLRGLGDRP